MNYIEAGLAAVANGGSIPSNLVHLNAATYTATSGDLVICDYNGTQTVTLPTSFNVGDQIAILRGNTVQEIHVNPGAGATIGGASQWISRADVVSTVYNATLLVKAVSSTLWVPIVQESFWSTISGSGLQLNDLAIHGTLNLTYNMWYNNTVSTSISMAVTAANLVILVTGAGGVTLTCDATIGTTQVIYIKNNSSGSCIFVPNGSGTIDGAASTAIIPHQGVFLMATGPGGANTSFTNLSPENPIGTNAAANSLGVQFEPYPAVVAGVQTAPATQYIYGTALYATAGATITGIEHRNGVAAAGTNPTTVRFGLLDNTGKVLVVSGNYGTGGTNNATTIFAVGPNRVPFTGQYVLPYNGIYIPCLIVNGVWGTTQPTPAQVSNPSGFAMQADGANPPANFALSGQTDLPGVGSSINITSGSTRSYYLPLY